jgi:hypothetical protein
VGNGSVSAWLLQPTRETAEGVTSGVIYVVRNILVSNMVYSESKVSDAFFSVLLVLTDFNLL